MALNSAARWLPSPAEPSRASGDAALTGLRVLVGLLWVYNVVWKTPPDFGENSNSGLFQFTSFAVEHPVFPPFSWVVEHLVLPNFTAFGWVTLASETTLAVLLLTGTYVKLAALLGIGQSLAIGMSVAEAPHEWPWAYFMMVGIHVVLLLGWSTRYLAVDAVRLDPLKAAGLLRLWGAALTVVGVLALALSFTEAPLASRGGLVGYQDLEVTLGNYNLLGALVTLAVGALMLAAATLRTAVLAYAATAMAVLAAVSVYAQGGRTEVLLGATNTSAALWLCGAVVAAMCGRRLTRSPATQAAHG